MHYEDMVIGLCGIVVIEQPTEGRDWLWRLGRRPHDSDGAQVWNVQVPEGSAQCSVHKKTESFVNTLVACLIIVIAEAHDGYMIHEKGSSLLGTTHSVQGNDRHIGLLSDENLSLAPLSTGIEVRPYGHQAT